MRKDPAILHAEFRANIGHLVADRLEKFDPRVGTEYRLKVLDEEHQVQRKVAKRSRWESRLSMLTVVAMLAFLVSIVFRWYG